MKLKTIPLLFIIVFIGLCGPYCNAQNKYEREYRIRKSQFPEKALSLIEDRIAEAKRVKFYKETDSAKISFEAKLKKDRLWYSIEFDRHGVLEDIEILIRPADVPNDTYATIERYLQDNFSRYRIKRLQQQYPAQTGNLQTTIKNAFQNLILPSNNYELIVAGKKEKNYMDYEILFDADGNFKNIRTSLPPNYDHVLY
ncbi:hypothetical protein ACNR9Q_01680 [Maribacter sp. X9]|uniref:hypothetical protein n=1 Tax=Maribacter sp. X9 TaxID=3402159 RepID=UPI003AF3CAB6